MPIRRRRRTDPRLPPGMTWARDRNRRLYVWAVVLALALAAGFAYGMPLLFR